MKLQVLGSSSKGNCYLLTANDGSTLIIEAGIAFLEIKRALAFNLSRIVGCVVSHRHGDHAKGLADMARAGVTVHCSSNVINSQDLDVQPLLVETSRRQWMLVGGEFEVLTLEAFHDVPCESFVIRHPEMGKLLFLTDSVSFPYKIQGLDHVLIEANYSDNVLEEKHPHRQSSVFYAITSSNVAHGNRHNASHHTQTGFVEGKRDCTIAPI